MTRRAFALAGLALAALSTAPLLAEGSRPLKADDIFALKTVADPQISPDGAWVSYTVRWLDAKEDSADSD
ncbi:MAG TPA: S9 family peptidase, partial [Thermoanaerobaculia bacterium]